MPWVLATGGMGTAPVGSGGSCLTKRGGDGIMLEHRGGGPVGDSADELGAEARRE
jgi:hypothetical protein